MPVLPARGREDHVPSLGHDARRFGERTAVRPGWLVGRDVPVQDLRTYGVARTATTSAEFSAPVVTAKNARKSLPIESSPW